MLVPAWIYTTPIRCAAAVVRLYTVICSVSVSHPSFYHTPKHTLWLFVCLCCHPPLFIKLPNTRCGCSDALSHPLIYHTHLGPMRAALYHYHRGYKIYHTPHSSVTHPVIIFSNLKMLLPGFLIFKQYVCNRVNCLTRRSIQDILKNLQMMCMTQLD